jgi:glutathionyl-hydroquinone reductase
MRALKGLEAMIDISVVNWRMLEHGWTSGLFNALFFDGMGRVSLKCHTPTQTAL